MIKTEKADSKFIVNKEKQCKGNNMWHSTEHGYNIETKKNRAKEIICDTLRSMATSFRGKWYRTYLRR